MSKIPQFFCRLPKSIELTEGQPKFKPVSNFVSPTSEVRCSAYSSDGKCFVYTQENEVVVCSIDGQKLLTIPNKFVLDFVFSEDGQFLTTWSRPVKANDDSGNWAENVFIYKLDLEKKTVEVIQKYVNKMQSGWKPQFTADGTIFCRKINSSRIDFFKADAVEGNKTLYSLALDEGKLEEFSLSPGKNPSIAVFIPGSRGNPAYIKVYSLPNLKSAISQKSFFKGESCKFTWNGLGTSLLALVTTAVDASNKSYYGESQLYLMGITGTFDQKINLDKEGPIHDITWSPTSREFAVIYGYMPSSTTFFDSRGNEIHTLPESSRNTIIYSPHAKYILVAGFGNLQGHVEIFDRQKKFSKVAEFKASNTSVCKWAPDGRFILTATTSPRLRVDNCVKIWYLNGTLCYVKNYDVLYNVDWRYQPLTDFPPIHTCRPDKCEVTPDISAVEFLAKKTSISGSTTSAPKGAYRPPHARNRTGAASRSLAEVEAARSGRSSPSSDESHSGESFFSHSRRIPGATTRRTIPGAVPLEKKSKKKRHHKKSVNNEADTGVADGKTEDTKSAPSERSLVVGGVFSLEEKKTRNLLKKLRSIQKLKAKKERGEFLEKTQELKIETESKVRRDLEALGWKGDKEGST